MKSIFAGSIMSSMNSDLSLAVSKLRSLSPQLNAAVVEADRVVALVERFLAQECSLGVEAEVPLHYNDKGKAVTLLRYASVNGTFRISVTHTDGSTHFVTRPWSECDRNQRLVSFSALPKLLIAVAKAVEQQIASTTSTVGTVGQIISALGISAFALGSDAAARPTDGDLTLLMVNSNNEASDRVSAPAPIPAQPPASTPKANGRAAKAAAEKQHRE